MILSEKALTLLRQLAEILEADRLSLRNALMASEPLEFWLSQEPAFVTEKPDVPLLNAVGSWDRQVMWRPLLLPVLNFPHRSHLPPRARSLVEQIVSELRPILSGYRGADDEANATLLAQALESIETYVYRTMRELLALLSHLPGRRELAFSIAFDQLDARINPARSAHYSGCYLYNLEVTPADALPITFDGGLELRLSTFADVVVQGNFQQMEGTLLPPRSILVHRRAPRQQLLNVNHSVGFIGEPPFDDVISALRLCKEQYVGRGRSVDWASGLSIYCGRGPLAVDAYVGAWGGGALPGVMKYQLKASDIEEVVKTHKALRAFPKRAKIAVALKRFNDSYRTFDHRERIVDLVIALESLFGEETVGQSTEVGYRLRMRAARYLGTDAEERQRLRKFITELYSLRSKIVHGDLSSTDELIKKRFGKPLSEVVNETQEIVRRTLRMMLKNPSQIGQDYFNDLLLGISE